MTLLGTGLEPSLLPPNLGVHGPDDGEAKLVSKKENMNLKMTSTHANTPSRDRNDGVKHNKQFIGFGQVN